MQRPKNLKFLIFSIIGIFNTLFDLVLYVVIFNTSHSIVIANIAATSAALVGSYILNARFTFKTTAWTPARFAAFVAVTVFGLWILQTGIIYAVTPIVSKLSLVAFGNFESDIKTLLPKLLATAVTFVWNFVWYNKVIFKTDKPKVQAIRALE